MELKSYLKNNKVIKLLISKGYKAYFVGGVVRNYYLEKKIVDIDITTNATPIQIKNIFNNTYDTGIKHGTITVKFDDILYEITTFRKEKKYINNRYPKKVIYIKNVKTDLKRRDFTMNTLLMDYNLNIIDNLKAINAIDNKYIKAVGNANKRFKEDALRMLRAIRFACQLDFNIEKETYNAIIKNKNLLQNISKERIYIEFKKAVLGKYQEKLKLLSIFDIFSSLNLVNIPITNDYILKLTYIISKSNNLHVLKLLKVDNFTYSKVKSILKNINKYEIYNEYEIKKLINTVGIDNTKRILVLNNLKTDKVDIICKRGDCTSLKELVITGNDLMREKIATKGNMIGLILEKLLDDVMKDPKLNEYNKLIELSKSYRHLL